MSPKVSAAPLRASMLTLSRLRLTSREIPRFFIVGLPDNAGKGSCEALFAAIKNSGYRFPNPRITTSLAPADFKKEGSAYDLGMALGILAAAEQLASNDLGEYVVLGDVALDGSVRPCMERCWSPWQFGQGTHGIACAYFKCEGSGDG